MVVLVMGMIVDDCMMVLVRVCVLEDDVEEGVVAGGVVEPKVDGREAIGKHTHTHTHTHTLGYTYTSNRNAI